MTFSRTGAVGDRLDRRVVDVVTLPDFLGPGPGVTIETMLDKPS